MEYKVEIIEVLSHTVYINAVSKEAAEFAARTLYKEEKLILDYSDLVAVNYRSEEVISSYCKSANPHLGLNLSDDG